MVESEATGSESVQAWMARIDQKLENFLERQERWDEQHKAQWHRIDTIQASVSEAMTRTTILETERNTFFKVVIPLTNISASLLGGCIAYALRFFGG